MRHDTKTWRILAHEACAALEGVDGIMDLGRYVHFPAGRRQTRNDLTRAVLVLHDQAP